MPASGEIRVAVRAFRALSALADFALIPRKQGRRRRHDDDPGHADKEMHPCSAGDFRQNEMSRKCEKHAKTENLERMLAAPDDRAQPGRFQARPVRGDEAHRDRRKRQKMDEAQHIEIGLVDRIHPAFQPARHEDISRGTCQVSVTQNAKTR
jgi:hypothetical protein